MYKPSILFERTAEERRDMFASWQREDQAFFAAGACHILANLFVQLHGHEGYTMIFIKPETGFSGNHMFASNGTWAFDHNGWTTEKELLEETENTMRTRFPEWSYERCVIENSITALEDFCKANNHRLPWQYAHLPWERAYKYIQQFSPTPPTLAK
ncbi:MAG: hypothetical protein WAT17_00005 [Candidatus Saccharimonadales bacterium]|jgi:hypothetical protein